MSTDVNSDITCRICLESCERHEVISPCNCKGTSKWVHRSCLDQWRSVREDKAFSKCTECLKSYTFVRPAETGAGSSTVKSRQRQFSYLVVRDLFLLILILQIPVVLFALITYAIDVNTSHVISRFFHIVSSNHSNESWLGFYRLLLYYLSGVVGLMECFGIFYLSFQCCVSTGCCGQPVTIQGASDLYLYYFYGESSTTAATTATPHTAVVDEGPPITQLSIAQESAIESPAVESDFKMTCTNCCTMVCRPVCCDACTPASDNYYYDSSMDRSSGSASNNHAHGYQPVQHNENTTRLINHSSPRRRRTQTCICCEPMYCYDCNYNCYYCPLYTSNDTLCCAQCSTMCNGEALLSGGCSCCDASVCAGTELGQECVLLLVVFVVVFAVIGLVVCIIVGSTLLENVVLKHVHVLQKQTLVQHYQVLDLCAEDNSVCEDARHSNLPIVESHRVIPNDYSEDDIELVQTQHLERNIVSEYLQRNQRRRDEIILSGVEMQELRELGLLSEETMHSTSINDYTNNV